MKQHDWIKIEAVGYLQQFLESLQIGLGATLSFLIAYLIAGAIVVVLCWLSHLVARRYLATAIASIITRANLQIGNSIRRNGLIRKFSHLAPAFVLYICTPLFLVAEQAFTVDIVSAIQRLNHIYVAVVIALIADAFFRTAEDLYASLAISRKLPIKSYLQVLKILLYIFIGIIIISALLGKSPWTFLTGLGAATAVIILIFRDTILGFVASISLNSLDMIRIGDWIELPDHNVDGDVIEISLNTVKVRNFDKTISTIPTYALVSTGVKNWRGMSESGGRRIKRSIYIDMKSVHFCDEKLLAKLQRIDCLRPYLESKLSEIKTYTENHPTDAPEIAVNARRLSNLGVFRAYLNSYLRRHDAIHNQGFTFLVRQLQPSERGIPLEVYVFTTTTKWTEYEAIQADIFDHILAAIPLFELQPFQNLSSHGLNITVQS